MKPNLIFGIVLLLGWGCAQALELNNLDITLRVEAKSLQKEQLATALCYSPWNLPITEPRRLSTTLNLSLSVDSTALGLSLQGFRQWLAVQLDGRGEGHIDYGKEWVRRSL